VTITTPQKKGLPGIFMNVFQPTTFLYEDLESLSFLNRGNRRNILFYLKCGIGREKNTTKKSTIKNKKKNKKKQILHTVYLSMKDKNRPH